MSVISLFLPQFHRAGLGRKPLSEQTRIARSVRLVDNFCLSHLDTLLGCALPDWLRHFKTKKGLNSRKRAFPTILTFWAFLAQVLDPDSSCRDAVSRVQGLLAANALPLISDSTAAYCQARARLSVLMLMRVLHFVTAAVVRAAGDFDSKGSPGFQGRLLVMDGSSVTLPDSNANRRQYSYPSGQKPGLGFPKMYLLGLFDLRSGASLRVVKSNTLRHDSALAWRLIGALRAGDILLADRAFCSYAFIVACQARGVFVLMRLHQSRKSDNGKGRALGAGDEIQTWAKPKTCPKDFSDSRFNALPASLDIRVVAQQVEVRGHRPETLYLATTLCNPQVHGAQAIAALYLRRWEVELMFDDLKTSQSMETLRCESPHMLARELLMHLIAYNLVRMLIVQAGKQRPAGQAGRLSFKGTLDRISKFHPALWGQRSAKQRARNYAELVRLIAEDVVLERPARREPRQIKRRPSRFPLMTVRRTEARLLPEPPKTATKSKRSPKTKTAA